MPGVGLRVDYDPTTLAANVSFVNGNGGGASALPDGDYRRTLRGRSVSDVYGNAITADVTFDFFVLGGDANRDRKVDFDDLTKLAQNYNQSGETYSDGDFNGDGAVDFNDLVILAQRYNTMLPPPPAASPAPVPVASASVAKEKPKPVFSTTTLAKAKPVPAKPKAVVLRRRSLFEGFAASAAVPVVLPAHVQLPAEPAVGHARRAAQADALMSSRPPTPGRAPNSQNRERRHAPASSTGNSIVARGVLSGVNEAEAPARSLLKSLGKFRLDSG